jgi:4-diphosphocytidyl-2-C-methyl-D-erythritol kinase
VPSQTGRISVRIPAKINIGLAVGGRRSDGFHPLDTVFHAVDLCDEVTAAPAAELSLSIRGEEAASLTADRNNLAWRAAALLAEYAGISAGAELQISKSIPVAAGLAGGSADAAGALIACSRLWQLSISTGELLELAARLGSDVGFCLLGGTARGTGRGEQLTPLPTSTFHWVLAAASGELSTAAVYAEFDRIRPEPPEPRISDALLAAVAAGDPAELAPLLRNDLQEPALSLAPYLRRTLEAGRHAGALAGLVSGSGPTCAFLTADAAAAVSLASRLSDGDSCRFARPVLGGVGVGSPILMGA